MAITSETNINNPYYLEVGQKEVLFCYTNVNQQYRVEKIECEGTVLFRYLVATTYCDYDVIKTERFFSSREKAFLHLKNTIKRDICLFIE